jgi:hypothetical protein
MSSYYLRKIYVSKLTMIIQNSNKLPVSSLYRSSTLLGACIIGTLPRIPLLKPNIKAKVNAVTSAEKIGLALGATHIIISGIIISLATEHRTKRPPVQYLDEDANIFPKRSAPLNNAIIKIGIQDLRRPLIISDAIPGYKQSVAKYTKHIEIMYG